MGADNLYGLALSARAAAPAPVAFDTTSVPLLRLDWNVAAFNGGTTPNITFVVDILGADGIWYPAYTTAAISAPAIAGVNLGPATATPVVLTKQARVRSVYGGAVVATDITFGLSLVGRN